MKDTRRQIVVYGEGKMNIELQGQVITLKNVIVSAQKLSNVRSTQMGVQQLDIKTIKQMPVVFGEADILRVLLTLARCKNRWRSKHRFECTRRITGSESDFIQ